MSIAQRLVNLSDGLSAEGILSAAKGGTGTTTGAGSSTPTISAIGYGGDDTATNPAGGATITLTGTNFASGARVLINQTAVSVVTVVSSTQITFTAPALSAGSYILYVVNLDGSTAIAVPGIQYSGTPAWTTAAGSLGTNYETGAVSTTVAATSDSAVSYSVVSGTLPSGVTINSSGTISGTSPLVGGSTTYTFTVRATDAELQDTDRQFSLTINPDVVTWSSANAFAVQQDAASTTTLSASSAAGQTVSYSVDTLPAGLTLSGATVSGTATTAGTTTTVATATAAVTGKTAQQTITWTVSIAADAYFKYTTLLLNAETAAVPFLADASTNNFQLTASGDAKPSNFGPYTPGYYSNYFDGNGDWLATSSTSLNTSDFTIEFWMNAANTSDRYIFTLGSDWGDQTGVQLIQFEGSFALTSGAFNWNTMGTLPPANTWAHVAIVRSGVNTKVYVNGVSSNAGIGSSATDLTATQIRICNGTAGYWPNLEGYISNLRIVKGTALYTANFTPPTQPLTAISGTVLLTCQSNRFLDASTNAFAITKNGDTKVSSYVPFLPNSSYSTYGSTYFDGTGDYLTVPANSAFQFTGNYTIEFWIYFTSVAGTQDLVSNYVSNAAPDWTILIAPSFQYYPSSASSYVNGPTPVANRWYHVAAVRSGTTCSMYIDGVSVGTPLTFSGTLGDATRPVYIGSRGGSSNFTNGYMSDVRITKSAVYTSNFVPPATPLTAVTNTSLLTLQTNQPHTNSQFLDNSTSALTITRAGNATQGAFSPYGGNWSNYFGGNSALTIGTSAANFLCTGSATGITATLEAWVYMTAYSTGVNAWLFSPVFAKGGTYINFGVRNGAVRFYWYDGATKSVDSTSTSDVPLNTWTHIAVTISGSTVKIYVNGALNTTSATFTGVQSAGSGTIPYIAYEGSGTFYSGYISNFRLSTSVVYTSAFTPSTTPLTPSTNTQLLTCQSNSYVDNSTNNYSVTPSGTVFSVQRFSPFATVTQTPTTHSVYFDGSEDYLTSPSITAASGDFTLEGWINANSTQPKIYPTAIHFNGVASTSYELWIQFNHSSNPGKIRFAVSTTIIVSSASQVANTWYHVAIVRSGSTVTCYIDGVSIGSTNYTAPLGGGALDIGQWPGSSDTAYAGYVSNVRFVNGTALYTSNFTPATQPLTAVSGTSLLTCQDAVIRDNSSNNFAVTVVGNTIPRRQNPFASTTSSAQDYTPAVFGSSTYFDGTGDYISVPDNVAFTMGAGDFTLECWVYLTSISQQVFIGTCDAGGNQGSMSFILGITSTGTPRVSVGYGGSMYHSSAASDISTGQWYHIAGVRYGAAVNVYVNGVKGSNQNFGSLAITDSSQVVAIGRNGNYNGEYVTGYISDVRIVKGTALYRSNFVPPQAPLQAVQNTVLLLNMDRAAVVDKSGKVVLETVGDAKVSTGVRKYGSSSLYFDGTGDYLAFPSNPQYAFGGGDFTVECWVYPSSSVTADQGLLYLGGNGTYAAVRLGIATNGVYLLCSSAGNSWAVQTGVVGTITLNTWTHIAVTRSGSSFRLFVNGTQVGTTQTSSASLMSGFNYLGTYQNTSFFNFTGYMDDVRVTTGYARYTANFTPPQQALLTK